MFSNDEIIRIIRMVLKAYNSTSSPAGELAQDFLMPSKRFMIISSLRGSIFYLCLGMFCTKEGMKSHLNEYLENTESFTGLSIEEILKSMMNNHKMITDAILQEYGNIENTPSDIAKFLIGSIKFIELFEN